MPEELLEEFLEHLFVEFPKDLLQELPDQLLVEFLEEFLEKFPEICRETLRGILEGNSRYSQKKNYIPMTNLI